MIARQTDEQRDIRQAMKARTVDVVTGYLGEPNRALSNRHKLRWNRRGSFMLDPAAGKWCDFETGEHGDVFDMIGREERLDAAGAFAWAVNYLGGSRPTPADRRERERERLRHDSERARITAAKRKDALAIWTEAMPLLSSPAEHYLRLRLGRRPIPHPVIRSSSLRFHPAPFANCVSETIEGRTIGATVAEMVDPATRQFVGIQRTFLDRRCRKIVRRMLGGSGCVIVVDRPRGDFGLAEGLEDAIRLVDFLGWDGPMVAAMNAGNLAKFPLLDGVESITVFGDNDEPDKHGRQAGNGAAAALAKRWRAAGRQAVVRAYHRKPEWIGTAIWAARRCRVRREDMDEKLRAAGKQAAWDDDDAPQDEPKQRKLMFPLRRFREFGNGDRPRYLVKGLIPANGLVLLWGEPKSGKSFVMVDIAMSIARGLEYRGHRVQKGRVVYLAFEGEAGFQARRDAYAQRWMAEHDDPDFFLITDQIDLRRQASILADDIQDQLGESAISLIVIDTLNRSLFGSESKDEDMAGYIRAADDLREHSIARSP